MFCPNYVPMWNSMQKRMYYENTRAVENIIKANTKEIQLNNDRIQEQLRIPILSGNINPQTLNNINDNISNDIMEFKRQMEEAADENADKQKKEGKKVVPYVASNIYTITYNKNNILSISIIYHELINGTNSYIRATYNYDLRNGKSMSIKDLFKDGVDYKNLINTEIRRQLTLNKSLYAPYAAEKFKGIAEDQPFYLEDGNIVLFFGFNEIAPLVSEIPVIKLPFSLFSRVVKPEFL